MISGKAKIALPARMHLAPQALADLQIAVLSFPYAKAVANFCHDIAEVSRRGTKQENPPYRRLSHLMLATAPALTQGFESYRDANGWAQYRALAVGTPNRPLALPTLAQIQSLIQIWAADWARRLMSSGNSEAASVRDRFLQAIAVPPPAWDWQLVPPAALAGDLDSYAGLSYTAIPDLLASLLHEQQGTIGPAADRQPIRWRRVISDGSGHTGVVVSQPFKATYRDQHGKPQEGYFAYRVDFTVQTQAGRLGENGKLKPWIFVWVSCQRYAHEPLVQGNYNRDASVLLGMNEARIAGYGVDSTLVRLAVESSDRYHPDTWQDQLADLLAAFQARPLCNPAAIMAAPATAGNLDQCPGWAGDEYYVIHAEGYQYGAGRGHKHAVKTGYSFQERGDIVACVLDLLAGRLVPDGPWASDIPLPVGPRQPAAMRSYTYWATWAYPTQTEQRRRGTDRVVQHRDEAQKAVAYAVGQALNGNPLHLYLLWHERSTYDAVYNQIRAAFLLEAEAPFPNYVRLTDIWIDDPTLLEPLDPGPWTPQKGSDFYNYLRKQHVQKRDAWRRFLQRTLPPAPPDIPRVAVIEMGQSNRGGLHPQQNIRGAIREAAVREGVNSQLVRTIHVPQAKPGAAHAGQSEIAGKDRGRALNAVLDAVIRQLGALYGPPAEIYERAGLPMAIAGQLDVIALCREQTTFERGDIHYALAVRLRSTGSVEVRLPDAQEWISYPQAGIAVGMQFAEARSEPIPRGKNNDSRIKLMPAQLARFAADILTEPYEHPTLILIEADGWRNGAGKQSDRWVWPQLKNDQLAAKRDRLDLAHILGHYRVYTREDAQLHNLLGVIRLRKENETPQYVPNRSAWTDTTRARDFAQLSGFCDETVPGVFHYFSAGRLPQTQKGQNTRTAHDIYMLEYEPASNARDDEYGANIAFKHPQMVEMVPFFVRPDLLDNANQRALCRVPHYLRISPAWGIGNLLLPYPMHLGQQLIRDQLPILGVVD